MGAENSILEDCHWNDVISTSAETDWSLRQAILKDETNVSVFQHKKKDKNSVDLLKRGAKNLRTLRHPNLLRFIASSESSDGSYLITEQVQPLSNCLSSLYSLEICAGLQSLLEALLFLHDTVGVSHNNVCLSSVYVTNDGAWKLGGLEHSCKFQEATAEFLDKCLAYRNEDAVSPEEKQGNISTSSDKGYARDVFGFGVLAEQLLEKLEDLGDLTKTFELRVQDECLHADPSQRPPVQSLLNDRLFRHDYLEVLKFVKNLPTKTEEEKTEFFRSVTEKLLTLPEELVAKCLAVPLLSRFVMLDTTANKCLMPSLLTPYKESKRPKDMQGGQPIPILSSDLFKENVIPELFRIFHIRDAHIRKVLLTHFASYVDLFDRETLEEVIFPQLLLGLRDTDDGIVASSLRGLSYLVPVLGGDLVIGGTRKKFFSEGMPKFGGHGGQEEKRSRLNVSGIMGKKMLLKDLATLSNKSSSPEDEKEAKRKERERKREEVRQRREERKKKLQEQQKNENNKMPVPEESPEISTIASDEEIQKIKNNMEDETEKADWSDWEANQGQESPVNSDDASYNEEDVDDEIENELRNMPSTISSKTNETFPAPKVDWSDTGGDQSELIPQTKGALKLGIKSKDKKGHSPRTEENIEKNKLKSEQGRNESKAVLDRFQENIETTEISDWGDTWDEADTNTNFENSNSSISGDKTVIKPSIPTPIENLGSEFDIKVMPVQKTASSTELDFFSDMMPDINVSAKDPLSVLAGIQEDSPEKDTVKSLSFAMVDAADATNQGDGEGEGWGDDLEWGNDEF